MSYESWVERQVREAAERGAFDGLSAAGKPLDPAVLTQTAGEWAVEWARREGADMTAALPPALALRRERQELVEAVPGKPTEEAVRAAVEHFNDRLDAAYRRPQEVPPVALAFVDVDRQLARWREAHPLEQEELQATPPAAGAGRGRGDRPWWSRALPGGLRGGLRGGARGPGRPGGPASSGP